MLLSRLSPSGRHTETLPTSLSTELSSGGAGEEDVGDEGEVVGSGGAEGSGRGGGGETTMGERGGGRDGGAGGRIVGVVGGGGGREGDFCPGGGGLGRHGLAGGWEGSDGGGRDEETGEEARAPVREPE